MDAKSQAQEPLSVFRKPEPAAPSKIPALSPPQRLALSRALAGLSAVALIVVIAADYCFKNGF